MDCMKLDRSTIAARSIGRQMHGRSRGKFMLAFLLCLISSSFVAKAQTPDPKPPGPPPDPARPPLIPLPQLENWSFLKDPSKRVDFFDPIKYVQIGDGNSYLSLGSEYRIEYERYTANNFGVGPQDQNGYLMQRVLPHFDLHLSNHFRIYNEFQFDYTDFRNGGPRPGLDEDRGDIHQLFFDVGSDVRTGNGVQLRAGRQELVYGRGRLLDNNEGPNVKLSFDGFKASVDTRGGNVDFFAVKPVNPSPGFFDDAPVHGQSLWGVYGSNIFVGLNKPRADIYYIGFDNKNASYDVGAGREIRHTFGGRFAQPVGKGLDFDWESAFQWGAFTDKSIHAYTVQTETGYTFEQSPGHIRPLLRFDVSSGNSSNDPNGHNLGTFNSLFPRGAYITPKMAPPFALDNVIDVHPMTWFQPFKHVETSLGWDWFWRYSTNDGLYAFPGFPIRNGLYGGYPLIHGNLTKYSYIGQLGDMEVRWSPAAHVIIAFNFAGTINGAFLNSTAKSNDITYINTGFTYRF
jgi:hypothetical protein